MKILEQKPATAVELKNILFATDFSDASEAALRYVAALSLRYGSTIHLAHVLPGVTFLRPGAPDPMVLGSIYEEAHSAAQEKMQRLADRLKGFPHQTYVRHGQTCEVLSQLIGDEHVDLVIAGTHGRTGLGKLVMGSVAEEILRTASCPVLTVGPNVVSTLPALPRRDRELPPAQINVHQILYATDFKQESHEAVHYALSLAREFRAHLGLLHVIESYGEEPYEHPGPIDTALFNLRELVPEDAGLRYVPDVLAEYGSPAECILESAADREADLIVLGVRPANGHLGAATHLGRAVAHKVIVGAHCPVLTVHN
jgi:nucleotide-binding universal stress UspA family protein